jgi:hypothetical protein
LRTVWVALSGIDAVWCPSQVVAALSVGHYVVNVAVCT